jgi:hypothetical protein
VKPLNKEYYLERTFLFGGVKPMTIKDRGLIKKFRMAAFQPDLQSKIKRMYQEQEQVSKPVIDEQYLEYMEQMIFESVENHQPVIITFYNNSRYEMVLGTIHYFDESKRILRVVNKFNEWQQINIEHIVNID